MASQTVTILKLGSTICDSVVIYRYRIHLIRMASETLSNDSGVIYLYSGRVISLGTRSMTRKTTRPMFTF